MCKFKFSIKIFIIFIFFLKNLTAENRILISLDQIPEPILDSAQEKISQDSKEKKHKSIANKTPSQITQKPLKILLKKLLPDLSGFIALYKGYMDYSTETGFISFPRHQKSSNLYLAITPRVELIKIKGNTISHQKYMQDTPTKIYLFEKKQDKNKQFFWQVSEQKLPANRVISPLTVVLLTKPKNIYIVQRDFMTNDSSHLILPDNIYVLDNLNNTKILLNTLNSKRYFETIKYKEKEANKIIYQKMISNL
ncbi:hypothetical protein K9L05_01150 [Candidatus Babeliales bacterium]|nr:hypothetical protein [Candidatus Babeliales bacterium]